MEVAIGWLHRFRRLRIRWERHDDIHEACLGLATCLITYRHVQRLCSEPLVACRQVVENSVDCRPAQIGRVEVCAVLGSLLRKGADQVTVGPEQLRDHLRIDVFAVAFPLRQHVVAALFDAQEDTLFEE